MGIFLAQNIRKYLIGGRDTCARVDHKQAGVSHAHRAFRQAAHAPLEAFVRRFFQSGRIYDGEF